MHRALILALCVFAFTVATGCGRSSFEIAPVHGAVSVDGKPLFQGKVMFAPRAKGERDPGKPAWGEIAKDGAYRLTTFKKDDGAVVGEHWITIINSNEELPEGVPEFARFMAPKPVTVAPGKDNRIDVQLTSAIIKEYREDDR
jgi:hypothetical protein